MFVCNSSRFLHFYACNHRGPRKYRRFCMADATPVFSLQMSSILLYYFCCCNSCVMYLT